MMRSILSRWGRLGDVFTPRRFPHLGGEDQPPPPTNAAIIAGAGSYLFGGTAATLRMARRLAASAGAYSFTGSAATLTKVRGVAAGTGAYNLTGTAATLVRVRKLVAAAGAYNFTGSAVALTSARRLAAAGGAYSMSGSAVTLTKGAAFDPYWINPGSNRTPIFKAAMTAMMAGTSDALMVGFGDSTMKGSQASTYADTPLMKMVAYLNALGTPVPSHGYSRWGFPEGYTDSDVTPSTWQNVGRGAGGDMFKNDTDTNDLQFSIPIATNALESYYWQEGTGGTGTSIKVDGVSIGTDTIGSGGVVKKPHTFTSGVHDFQVARTGGNVFLEGQMYRSATKRLIVNNFGLGGASASDLTDASNYHPLGVILVLAPHLVYLDACINGGATKAAHKASISTIIDALDAAGIDCIISTPNPSAVSGVNFDDRCEAMRELCVERGKIGLDLQAAWGMTYSNADSVLHYMTDGAHPNNAGYLDKGQRMGALLNFCGFN